MSISVRAAAVLAAVVGLWASALAVGGLFGGASAARPASAAAAAFARVTGGYGTGSSALPTWTRHDVDPRLERHCPCDHWPHPGGPCFCPGHTVLRPGGSLPLPALGAPVLGKNRRAGPLPAPPTQVPPSDPGEP